MQLFASLPLDYSLTDPDPSRNVPFLIWLFTSPQLYSLRYGTQLMGLKEWKNKWEMDWKNECMIPTLTVFVTMDSWVLQYGSWRQSVIFLSVMSVTLNEIQHPVVASSLSKCWILVVCITLMFSYYNETSSIDMKISGIGFPGNMTSVTRSTTV